MTRTRLPLLFLALASACGGGQAAPKSSPPPEVTRVEIYQADDWRAEVAHLDEPDAAIIRFFDGSGGELDGFPLVYRFESADYGRRWVTRVHGRERSVLYGVRSSRDGSAPWRLHAPGARDGRPAKQLDEPAPEGLGDEIARQYARLLDEGKIDALQRFDRAREIGLETDAVRANLESTRAACDHPSLEASLDFDGVDDEVLLTQSLESRCGAVLYALRGVCGRPGGAEWARESLERVRCELGDEPEPSVRREGGVLTFTFALESVNLDQKARDALLATAEPEHQTLGRRLIAASSSVCTDESGERLVILSPDAEPEDKLAYGTAERLHRIPAPWGISEGWFQDPRFFNEKLSDSFRGHDLRFYSRVEATPEGCTLVCGTREVQLTRVEGAEKAAALALSREPTPFDRVPHALARDKSGTYYYVDRGNTEATAKDFRLYRGRRGAVKQLDMKDVVSDSEGEVFESRTGALRLIVDRDEAVWIRGKARDELKALPLGENLGLIFNELGVYLGRELGTPCDDL